MKVRARNTTFRPSRAIFPFAGAFLLISLYVIIRIFPGAPTLLLILLIPYVAFLVWWFVALIILSMTLKVTATPAGLEVSRSSGGFLDTDEMMIQWDEIQNVSFSYSKEFTPATFTGRNATLTLDLADGKQVAIDHIMTLDQYTDLFEIIQQRIPFTYELPREQLMGERSRQLIVIGIIIVFMIIFLLFIS